MAQLPAGAEGVAAGVLIWAFACLAANALLSWLLWTGKERRSYLFIATCLTMISTVSSIIQQLHDIIYYEDMMYARLALVKAHTENAQVIATDGRPPGVDLVLWCIRWACYVGECGMAYFWSFTLCQAVYGWRDDRRWGRLLEVVSEMGKPFGVLISAFTMAVLQIPALQRSYFWWNFVLNFFYCLFCAGSLFWFLLMFIEFSQTRLLFRRMNSQQRRDWERQPTGMSMESSNPTSNTTTTNNDNSSSKPRHQRSSSTVTSSTATVRRAPTGTSDSPFGALAQRQGGIYDKFLIARTLIPCAGLTAFECYNIVVNNSNIASVQRLALTTEPDLTAATARAYLASFIPGCLASLVLALAFCTTRSLRVRVLQLIVPGRWLSYRFRRAAEYRYQAMDSDAGILSRQKRLSMEKRLKIEVTYEFEIRTEQVIVVQEDGGGGGGIGGGGRGSSLSHLSGGMGKGAGGYGVESHGWDDTARILPRKPGTSATRGQD